MQSISNTLMATSAKHLATNEWVLEILPNVYSGMMSIRPQEDITIVTQSLDIPIKECWSLIFMLEGELELTSFVKDNLVSHNFTPNTFTLFYSHSNHGSCS